MLLSIALNSFIAICDCLATCDSHFSNYQSGFTSCM